jgi:ribosomal protein S18 acetylase RimI-like enzyme
VSAFAIARAEPTSAWQAASSSDVLDLLHRECTRWSIDLGWDLARDWAAVEPARQAGLLPGWITRDDNGRARGWAFGVDGAEVRQIGALVADNDAAADALLRDIVATPSRIEAFVRNCDGLTAALWHAHGFAVQPYDYLVAPLRPPTAPAATAPTDERPWRSTDVPTAAELFMRAYAADTSLRPFARTGRIDDWEEYVRALTERPGCGVFVPECSVVVEDGGLMAGVALVTSVGATTAHLAQLAVAPGHRGRGLAMRLLCAASERARTTLGASRISLLVSRANTVAQAIYRRVGFAPVAEFTTAVRAEQEIHM